MSFNGIAWAGNVYEKFETMCLEVEEAMYQDTVKYMENQAQKVGVSVKKFYSEVMKDLQPLSCIDPKALASDDLSLISHGHTDGDKKPTPNTLKKDNEDQVFSSVTEEKGSSFSGYDANIFSSQSHGILIEDKSSEKFGGGKKLGVNRRPIGIKRISRNNHTSKESSMSDRRSKVANCSMQTTTRLPSDNTYVTSSLDLNERSESGGTVKVDAPTASDPFELPTSVRTSPSESVREGTCDDTKVASSSGTVTCERREAVKGNTPSHDDPIESSSSKIVLLDEAVRLTKDVSDCCSPASDNNLLDVSIRLKEDSKSTSPTESTGTPMKDGSSSSGSTCNEDSITSGDILNMDDGFDIELVGNNEVAVSRPENFGTSGRVNLEESCILVEGEEEEIHYSLPGTKKHKSYKRRIREALSSKKDDQFVSQYEGGEDQQALSLRVHGIDSEKQSFESDWELL